MVSTDSCLAVSMKEQVFTTRISASSGFAVRRAPARSRRPIMTSESTRFLGQPSEMNPTEGAAGGEILVTVSLYRWTEYRDHPTPATKTCRWGSWQGPRELGSGAASKQLRERADSCIERD